MSFPTLQRETIRNGNYIETRSQIVNGNSSCDDDACAIARAILFGPVPTTQAKLARIGAWTVVGAGVGTIAEPGVGTGIGAAVGAGVGVLNVIINS
jgi:hypothetical protein